MMSSATAMHTRRWTRAEYERLVGEGFFHPEERLELIAGELLQKMTPQGSLHSTGIRSVEEVLRPIFFNKGFDIRIQMPVALSDDSEPEPDVAVVPGSLHDYRDAHPTTAALIVEVADSTVEFDRQHQSAPADFTHTGDTVEGALQAGEQALAQFGGAAIVFAAFELETISTAISRRRPRGQA